MVKLRRNGGALSTVHMIVMSLPSVISDIIDRLRLVGGSVERKQMHVCFSQEFSHFERCCIILQQHSMNRKTTSVLKG